jgi:hypothetical protein
MRIKDWTIRDKLKVGDLIEYRNKKYLVIHYFGDHLEQCMIAGLIRVYKEYTPLIRLVKEVSGEDIEDFTIL